ncbi:hypothetical protein H0H92_002734 [Tricholoma furcatifolium]|nr:hypothetical protein H0H92_002734 [Tricholoma furcatifolium]
MSLRAFTVFQDTPSTDLAKPVTPAASLTSPKLTSRLLIVNGATTVSTAEKENVHPLTGERPGPSTANSKKRKTSVLATKLQTPLSTKKQKESNDGADSTSDVKKRKSTGTSKVKKDGKASTSRKVTKKPLRRVSPLPKVDEEAERERDRITQANIDSRCHELTVKPLADVSQAFEDEIPVKPATTREEDMSKFRSVKESSAEPEIRDYFSSSQSTILPSGSDGETPAIDSRTFSTPERKQIYAAFTFASPSPTSERFSKATRASSVVSLELL